MSSLVGKVAWEGRLRLKTLSGFIDEDEWLYRTNSTSVLLGTRAHLHFLHQPSIPESRDSAAQLACSYRGGNGERLRHGGQWWSQYQRTGKER